MRGVLRPTEVRGSFGPTIPEDEERPAYMSDPNFKTLLESYRDQIVEIQILKRALEYDLTEI